MNVGTARNVNGLHGELARNGAELRKISSQLEKIIELLEEMG